MPPRSAAEPDLELAGVDVELGNFRKQDVSPSYSQVQSSSDKVPASDKAPDAETPPPSFFTILSLSKPEWPFLIFAFLLMIAGEAFGLYIPLCLASVYDAITNAALSSDDMLSVIQTKMGLVFVLHWSAMILATIRGTIIGIAGERVVARLRNDLYNHLLVQDLSWHDSMKTGDLVSRLGTDTTLIQGLTTGSLPEIVINLIKVVACITLMVIISPKLAGLTFAVVLFLLVTVVPFGAYIGSLAKKYNDALADAAGKSTEALGSMRTVRSFAAEKKEAARYTSKIGEPSKAGPCWFPFSDTDTTYLHGTKKALVSAFVFCILGLGVAFSAMYGTLWVSQSDVGVCLLARKHDDHNPDSVLPLVPPLSNPTLPAITTYDPLPLSPLICVHLFRLFLAGRLHRRRRRQAFSREHGSVPELRLPDSPRNRRRWRAPHGRSHRSGRRLESVRAPRAKVRG